MKLRNNRLYILSGLPGSGKSYWLKNNQIEQSKIISTDFYRELLETSINYFDEFGKPKIRRLENNNNILFEQIIPTILETKLRNGETIFLDATNLDEKTRNKYANLANQYNIKTEIIIFDIPIEMCIKNDNDRLTSVSVSVIERMNTKFVRTSKHKYHIINEHTINDKIEFIDNEIDSSINIDAIGDVHGCLDELIELLLKGGYEFIESKQKTIPIDITKETSKYKNFYNKIPIHKDKRKVLLLGDVVDRGYNDINSLIFTINMINHGHYFILGNHELKLLRFINEYENGKQINTNATSLQTFNEYKLLSKEIQLIVKNFLNNSKYLYVQNKEDRKLYFTHADISSLENLSKARCVYGDNRNVKNKNDITINNDELLDRYCKYNNLNIELIRGHIPQTYDSKYVTSLENAVFIKGSLKMYKTDTKEILEVESTYDFNEKYNKTPLLIELEKLEKEKMIIKKENDNGLIVWKYSKRVFFDNLWHQHELLLKARGLITDKQGNIIVHPFEKIFNFNENKTGLDIPKDKEVIAVEKINGFLGCITKHPNNDELIYSTTGSITSDFCDYIKDFVPKKLENQILNYLKTNNNTLLFEVVHPIDKKQHIIQYDTTEEGLYLIGERNIKTGVNSNEYRLDKLGKEFDLKRPNHFKIKFGELQEKVKTSQLEGFVVRDTDKNQTPLLKFKTNYYLITKFLARMGEKQITEMFNNTNNFKQKVEEEFYELIDFCKNTFTLEQFKIMNKEEKTKKIISFLDNRQKNNFQEITF